MIKVHKLTFNAFQENTYILSDETGECAIIDPGCYERSEQAYLVDYMIKNQLKPVKLVNTHCHIDHVLGNNFAASQFGLPLGIHKDDLPTLNAIPGYAHIYGFNGYQTSPEPAYYFDQGDKLEFGHSSLEIIFTPGHAPGHVVFYNEENQFVINGDVLFKGSFGRVDLPGGDFETLKKTILEKMFALPDNTLVYAGHGPETTIGIEKKSNPIRFMEM